MNRAICVLISVASCACAPAPTTGFVYQAAPGKCDRDGANPPSVRINTNAAVPAAHPPNRCIRPGEELQIVIRPANHPLNTVSIIAKTNNPDGGGPLNWLNGVNKTRDNIIRLQVPDADQLREYCYNLDDESCYFDYAIYVKGKIPVDPRVTVRK